MMSRLSQSKSQATTGLLVVDNHRRIVSLNRKFIEIWNLPRHLIASRDEDQALEFVSSQFEEPKSFIKKVRELNGQPDLESYDTIKFKDGRVVERHSQPQWLGEKYVGRVWICREISHSRCSNELTLVGAKIFRVLDTYQAKLW
jgi:hypothetical protein